MMRYNVADELKTVSITPEEDEMLQHMTAEQVTDYLLRKEKEL